MNDQVQEQTPQAVSLVMFNASGGEREKWFEPYVDENVVARFLQITPRRVLEMARKGEIPSHPFGQTRKTWRFRLSEIDAALHSA